MNTITYTVRFLRLDGGVSRVTGCPVLAGALALAEELLCEQLLASQVLDASGNVLASFP